MSDAVITGVGVVSAFGLGAPALFDGLAEGRSAVGPIRSFDASAFPTRVAGEVPVRAIDAALLAEHLGELAPARAVLEAWETSGLLRDRKVGFALLAAAEAWRSAGAGPSEREAALSLALGLEQAFLEDFVPVLGGPERGGAGQSARIDWQAAAADAGARPAAADAGAGEVRFRSQLDACAGRVEDLFGLEGAVLIHTSACAAGGLAVAHAAALIERGEASVVLCGASDSMVNPLGVGGMSRLNAPSPRAEPDACRPFDRRRDGLAMGEGAAMFVLEREDRARARGARPLARVLGWGSTEDAYRATAPRPDGSAAARAMRRALERAHLAPERIGWVNAHGTGTPLNDPAEVRAIRAALGEHAERVGVNSIKGAVGHLMAASGAIELAACLLAFERDLLPGTAHHRERDPECDLDIIGERPRPASVDAVLSNSFGFGGQNVSLALGRCP